MDLKHELMYCGPPGSIAGGIPGPAGDGAVGAPVVAMNGVMPGVKTEQLNGNGKRPSPDWDSSPSHSDSAAAAPLTPSPGPHPHYTAISNGYASPVSSGSYDPYSPNGKLGECSDAVMQAARAKARRSKRRRRAAREVCARWGFVAGPARQPPRGLEGVVCGGGG